MRTMPLNLYTHCKYCKDPIIKIRIGDMDASGETEVKTEYECPTCGTKFQMSIKVEINIEDDGTKLKPR